MLVFRIGKFGPLLFSVDQFSYFKVPYDKAKILPTPAKKQQQKLLLLLLTPPPPITSVLDLTFFLPPQCVSAFLQFLFQGPLHLVRFPLSQNAHLPSLLFAVKFKIPLNHYPFQ